MRSVLLNCLAIVVITPLVVYAKAPQSYHKKDRHQTCTPPTIPIKPHFRKPVKPNKPLRPPSGRILEHDVRVAALITRSANRHGVPHHIAQAVAQVESGYRCNAVSSKGARGVMQVRPKTALEMGVTGNLLNCETSIEAGMRYLKVALNRPHSMCTNLSFYDRGLYARPACTPYGRKVLARAISFLRDNAT